MNSTHKVEVVPVQLEKHPNADSLSIVRVFGYTVVVRTEDWVGRESGAYIPPDSVVPVLRPEFAWLGEGHGRIRAKKLRGIQSFGLLIPTPDGAAVGDDVAEQLGVTHYEPVIHGVSSHGEAESAPQYLQSLTKFDVDSLRRYPNVLTPSEEVMVTEKIHGASARYCYMEGRMWAGSRAEWKRYDARNLWWRVLSYTPEIESLCRDNPRVVLYGEVYGNVQSLKYDLGAGIKFAAFDVYDPVMGFLDAKWARHLCEVYGVPQVPLLDVCGYDFDAIATLAEGQSTIASHVREGCVVKPLEERWNDKIGRVILKCVGAGYLEKDK